MAGETSQPPNYVSLPESPDPKPSTPPVPRALTDPAYLRSLILAYSQGKPPFFSESDSDDEGDPENDWSMLSQKVPPLQNPLPDRTESPIVIDDDGPVSDIDEPEAIDPKEPPCGVCGGCHGKDFCNAPVKPTNV